MRRLLAIPALLLLLFPALALASDGLYLGGNVGLSLMSDSDLTYPTIPGFVLEMELDAGMALSAAMGYGFGNTRIEGEFGWQRNDASKVTVLGVGMDLTGDISMLSFLVNGYYEFGAGSVLTPFVSGGVGLAKVEVNELNVVGSGDPGDNGDDTVLAYQVGGGFSHAPSDAVTIDLRYRFFGTADPELDGTTAEVRGHMFSVGIRFGLN